MLFNTWSFGLFFAVVLALHAALRPTRARNALLLVASYVFYGLWDWRFLGLIGLSTAIDWVVAGLIERALGAGQAQRARRLVTVSVVANLGILGTFKYLGFFVGSAARLLAAIGLDPSWPVLELALPVGISFYTFQSLGYTIDVYRGDVPAVRDPLLFALYIAYFPQLVAGPIERAGRLLPQLAGERRVTLERLGSGAFLAFTGYVRKVGVADVIAPRVDAIFAHPEAATSGTLVLGAVLFAVQIYADFAGYSEIARGTSRMLGVELSPNFRHPYFATDVRAFWRRWHVTLSTWLRDYLYVPLGGSRRGTLRTYRNLLVTMVLGGLWHGAAWHFVAWGAVHGVALAIHRAATGGGRRRLAGPLGAVSGWGATMVVVLAAWVLFRAPDLASAGIYLRGLVAFDGAPDPSLWPLTIGLVGWLLLLDVPQALAHDELAILSWPWPVRGLLYAGSILAMLALERAPDADFIYFQF